MSFKYRNNPRVLFFIAAALYSALIFFILVIRKIPLRMFSLFIIAFALIIFITITSKKKENKVSFFLNSMIFLALGCLCLILSSTIILKLYPLLLNILFLITFIGTLFSPPSIIFRFVIMQDRSIIGSLNEKRVSDYCHKVTYMWCVFFIFNGILAACTIISGSDIFWSVYNGLISYILIGLLFAGEFMVRKIVQEKMPKCIPLSAFKNNSRPRSTVLCYEGKWSDAVYKTWGDFLEGTSELRRIINAQGGEKWLLHCEDCWYFLLALTALLQCKKEILLRANLSPAYIEEIRGSAANSLAPCAAQIAVPFLTDQIFPEGENPQNTFHIPSLLKSPQKTDTQTEEAPAINADETSIIMYTFGSTGKPDAAQQRLMEFEADNRFIISKWGDEFLKRKLCSTVSQHHIYGILFSILLPFTLGAPFRRRRIEFPEEMEKCSDTEYMLITAPAFLKRAVEMENPSSLNLKSPWIFTLDGALEFETAKKINDVFGFWPVEVYGTETSGIAWRRSVNGQEWSVFDNKQEPACLF